jgi:hypothetical protein
MEKKFKSQNFDQLIFWAKILAQILVLYDIGRPSYGCMKV